MTKKGEHQFVETDEKVGDAYVHVCMRCGRRYVHKEGTAWNPRGAVCPGKLTGRAASNARNRIALKKTARRMLDETSRDRKLKKRLRKQGVKVRGRIKAGKPKKGPRKFSVYQ